LKAGNACSGANLALLQHNVGRSLQPTYIIGVVAKEAIACLNTIETSEKVKPETRVI